MQRIWITLFLAVLPGTTLTQMAATPGKTSAFDVVSIRENKSNGVRQEQELTTSGYHGRAVAPLLLVVTAYVPSDGKAGLFNPEQVDGLPDWMLQGRYDVEAKVANEDLAAWKQPEVQRVMLQQMLADRFKLALHREYKEKPVFYLVLAKGGPKFKPSETIGIDAIRRRYPTASALPGGIGLVRGPKPRQMTLIGTSVADLGILLDKGIGRPIGDKTGLTGRYDIDLDLDTSPGTDGSRPDPIVVVMNALEQLGLKLESATGKVEVLVIDHVERPSDN